VKALFHALLNKVKNIRFVGVTNPVLLPLDSEVPVSKIEKVEET